MRRVLHKDEGLVHHSFSDDLNLYTHPLLCYRCFLNALADLFRPPGNGVVPPSVTTIRINSVHPPDSSLLLDLHEGVEAFGLQDQVP